MAVYVDPLVNYGGSATFRWKKSCHLIADTEEELHAFAKRIGLRRAWFQTSRRGLPHYDLNDRRRAVAVEHGAVEITLKEMGERVRAHWQKLKEQEASQDDRQGD